jgi:pilus assembly protein Flp/PilA
LLGLDRVLKKADELRRDESELATKPSVNCGAKPNRYFTEAPECPNVRSLLACFVQNQRGATAIEYGLIAGIVTLAVVGGIAATGTSIGALYAAAIARIVAVL